jgi:peptide/nickel transport system permease protein
MLGHFRSSIGRPPEKDRHVREGALASPSRLFWLAQLLSVTRDMRRPSATRRPRDGARPLAAARLPGMHHPILRYMARRLTLGLALLFLVSVLIYVLLALVPGDAAVTLLWLHATPARVAQVRHQLGLDRPLYIQYWSWLKAAVHGNLGTSYISGQSVEQTIRGALPATISVVLCSLAVSTTLGVGLGVLSATRSGVLGRFVDVLSLMGLALPAFWLATMLVDVFAVKLRWLPAVGYVPLTQSPLEWVKSLILPVTALSVGAMGGLAKNTREAMRDVLTSEHIRMARACGIPERKLVYVYAMKNIGIRLVTLAGLTLIGLLGATVFVETIFGMPGLGGALVRAVGSHDLPMVQGIAVFFTIIIVCVNLVVDLIYGLLDPRVHTA